jgi:hypothetical protein
MSVRNLAKKETNKLRKDFTAKNKAAIKLLDS